MIARKSRYRILSLGILLFIIIIIIWVGIWQLRLPPLPQDRLVIAIALFTPVGGVSLDEAQAITYWIKQKLQEKREQGAPLEIRLLEVPIKVFDEATGKNNAIARGKRVAHVVLWGEVIKDDGELYIKPHLSVTRSLQKISPKKNKLKLLKIYEPDHLKLKKEPFKYIAYTPALFTAGYAYFKVQNWEKAFEILKDWAAKQRVIANTRLELALVKLKDEKAIRYLHDAVDAYQAALGVWTREAFPQDWAKIQIDLGSACDEIGQRLKGEESTRYLHKAETAYRSALEVIIRKTTEEWALTQYNLGLTLSRLGIRVKGEEGIRILYNAINALRAAQEVYTQEAFPRDWACTQRELGTALAKIGECLQDEEGIHYIQEAVTYYRSALEVLARKISRDRANNKDNVFLEVITVQAQKTSEEWAWTQYTLGLALGNLGIQAKGEEGIHFLYDAVNAWRAAQEVYTQNAYPQKWLILQRNLGEALHNMGILEMEIGKKESSRHFLEATAAHQAALEVCTREADPEEWAKIQIEMGVALEYLGILIGGKEGIHHIDEAIQHYDNAFSIAEVYPDLYKEIGALKKEAIQKKEILNYKMTKLEKQ